ncbi:hypothetical protein RQP46_001555 [Phenoliferia psychrophenolica]
MSSSHPSKYGIHADYHQLLDAAKAFSEFSKVVHTLDLIILRRGQLGAKPVLSTITPPPRAALHTLPVEILLLKDLIGRLLRSRGLQLSTNTPDFLMNDYLFITGKGRARNYRVAVVLPPHSPITPHEDQKFARLARDFCLRLGSEFTVYVEEDRVDGEDGKAAGKKGAAKDASRRKVVQPAVLLQ